MKSIINIVLIIILTSIIYSCKCKDVFYKEKICGLSRINPQCNTSKTKEIVFRARVGLSALNIFKNVDLTDSTEILNYYKKTLESTAKQTPEEVVTMLNFGIESFCFKHQVLDKDRFLPNLDMESRKRAQYLYEENLKRLDLINDILNGRLKNPIDSIIKKKLH